MQRFVGRCGNCQCLVRHWRLTVSVALSGNDGIDQQTQPYKGEWILSRRLSKEPDSFSKCVFLSRPVDITFLAGDPVFPGLRYGAPPTGALWALIFDRTSPEGSAESEWFSNRWALFAGAWYWPEGRDHFSGAEPILYYNTGDVLTGFEPQIAAYVFRSWGADDPTPGLGDPTPENNRRPFRCLNPNVFYRVEGVWDSLFPLHVTLEPFWP